MREDLLSLTRSAPSGMGPIIRVPVGASSPSRRMPSSSNSASLGRHKLAPAWTARPTSRADREPTACLRSRLCERTSLQDDTLIAAAQQGDAAAFEELVRRHQEAAFRAAFLVLRDADEAEDAAQEGLVKAYRAIRSFRLGREFRPWLLRIVVNQALTMHRSRRRGAAAAERLAVRDRPLPHSIDETVIDRERARLVWAALDSLREQERVVVYL